MSDGPLPPWPRFELVTASGHGLPGQLAARYPVLTLPGEHGIRACTPATELQVMTAPDGEVLIVLGRFLFAPLCLNPATGQVVDLVVDQGGNVVRSQQLVNSTLDQYVRSVGEATALFPYHDEPDDIDALYAAFTQAADRVRRRLEPIDPPAWYLDGFWDTFYWDITIGDYSPSQFART